MGNSSKLEYLCVCIYTNASFFTSSLFGIHYCSQASRQSVALSQLFLSLMGPHHLNSSFPLVIHLYSFLSFFSHHFISLLIFNSFFSFLFHFSVPLFFTLLFFFFGYLSLYFFLHISFFFIFFSVLLLSHLSYFFSWMYFISLHLDV